MKTLQTRTRLCLATEPAASPVDVVAANRAPRVLEKHFFAQSQCRSAHFAVLIAVLMLPLCLQSQGGSAGRVSCWSAWLAPFFLFMHLFLAQLATRALRMPAQASACSAPSLSAVLLPLTLSRAPSRTRSRFPRASLTSWWIRLITPLSRPWLPARGWSHLQGCGKFMLSLLASSRCLLLPTRRSPALGIPCSSGRSLQIQFLTTSNLFFRT